MEIIARILVAKSFVYHDRTGAEKIGMTYVLVDSEGKTYFCQCFQKRIGINGVYATYKNYVKITAEIKGTRIYLDQEQIDINIVKTLSIASNYSEL